jgi:hypothetical protein
VQKILQTRPDAPQLQFELYFTGIIKKCKNELTVRGVNGKDTHQKIYTSEGYKLRFFSVSNEHQEQGAKARNSKLFQA